MFLTNRTTEVSYGVYTKHVRTDRSPDPSLRPNGSELLTLYFLRHTTRNAQIFLPSYPLFLLRGGGRCKTSTLQSLNRPQNA